MVLDDAINMHIIYDIKNINIISYDDNTRIIILIYINGEEESVILTLR